MKKSTVNEPECEFGEYFGVEELYCGKLATYTYRSKVEDGRVYHFCKEHYSDVADEDEEE